MTQAYVVIDEPCDAGGCENGMAWLITVERNVATRTERGPCLVCHGTGTVQRRVTCETCRYATNYSGVRDDYQCAQLPVGLYAEDEPHVDGDWGCASWEAKP